jgi:hypothetical protein
MRSDGRPHDVPSAGQLVEAVREFLERDVMTNTEGRVQFHTRVAINALKMVERELAQGEEQADVHAARLATLGVSSENELCDAIASGALDARLDEVVAVVRATVADKLAVAHPDYASG